MNPYLRAAEHCPEIRAQAVAALEERRSEAPDGDLMERARDEEGRFIGDDPATPENEAWRQVQS